jgi:hypothetical protein
VVSASPVPGRSIEVFFSYSHRDEALRDDLADHLRLLERQGIITGWHDRRITGATEWAGAINEHLRTANIILLLISSAFLASDYCYDVELAARKAALHSLHIPPDFKLPVPRGDTPAQATDTVLEDKGINLGGIVSVLAAALLPSPILNVIFGNWLAPSTPRNHSTEKQQRPSP